MMIIASLVIAGSVVAPTQAAAQVDYAYTGMPIFTASGNAQQPADGVRMLWQSTTVELRRSDYTLDSVTLFRNMTDKPVEGIVIIPVVYSGSYINPITVRALWSDQPVSAEPSPGVLLPGTTTHLRYRVSMRPYGQHSLKFQTVLPVGKTGLDAEERLISYKFVDLPYTIQYFNYAIRYEADLVFRVIGEHAYQRWQIGRTGAFLKRDNIRPDGQVVNFRYYPGGFDAIGDH